MSPKIIIFDLDGVLVSAKDMHYHALNEALAEVGSDYVISYSDHLSKFDGLPTNKKLELLTIERGLPKESYQLIWNAKQRKTIEYINKNMTTDVRMVDELIRLKNEGYKLYVASNSIHESIKMMLLKKGLLPYIDYFFSNEDVKYSKPSSEIYLRCFIHANCSPKEAVIVEDSPAGIKAAIDSGANVLIVKNPEEVTSESIINYINSLNQQKQEKSWDGNDFNILIPMAGAGSRFTQAGYTFPKPLIEVNGKPMIQVVTENLGIKAKFIYVVQKLHYEKYSLQYLLNLITPNCEIVITEGVTEGAACTTLLAKDYINNDKNLIIANSDQFMDWDANRFFYTITNSNTDGTILTFQSTHPKWSFVKLNEQGFITEVAEKQPISDIATVGIYHWSKGSDYVRYAEQMIKNNIRVNNEFYVAPVYNEAIKDGKKFKNYNIQKMWGLGTPEDLNYFIEHHE